MQPPGGRLRPVDSIPTEEDDAEFVRQKQESNTKLKSRLEQIFEKYENMPDSKSDVIDLQNEEIVVDNGHYRERAKDPKALEAVHFLGDFLNPKGHYDEDSEDELAEPESSTPKPKSLKRDRTAETGVHGQVNLQTTGAPAMQTPITLAPAIDRIQLMDSLTQLQTSLATPPGVQHGPNILQNLNQFTQALSLALPALLGTPQNVACTPALSPLTAVAPPTDRYVAPATDPKWSFPEFGDMKMNVTPTLSRATDTTLPTPSSASDPTPARKRRRVNRSTGQEKGKPGVRTGLRTSARLLREQERVGTGNRISSQVAEGDTKEQSSAQGLPITAPGVLPSPPKSHSSPEVSSDVLSSPCRKRQVPNVQSLDPEGSNHQKESDSRKDNSTTLLPPVISTENLEPLPLVVNENPMNVAATVTDNFSSQVTETVFESIERNSIPMVPESVDRNSPMVLESVERDSFMDKHLEQRHKLIYPRVVVQVRIPRRVINPQPVQREPVNPEPAQTEHVNSEPANPELVGPELVHPEVVNPEQMPQDVVQLPSHEKLPEPPTYIVEIDESDDDELDLVPTDEPPQEGVQAMAPPKPLDCDLPDELGAPVTPCIKREPKSPRPASLFTKPLRTPKSAPHGSRLNSSARKSTPRLSKSQLHKKVTAQWAKPGRSKTPRKSMPHMEKKVLPMDDSEDELSWLFET